MFLNKLKDMLVATRYSLNIVGDNEKFGTNFFSFLCPEMKDYFGVSRWRNKFLFRSLFKSAVNISNKTT